MYISSAPPNTGYRHHATYVEDLSRPATLLLLVHHFEAAPLWLRHLGLRLHNVCDRHWLGRCTSHSTSLWSRRYINLSFANKLGSEATTVQSNAIGIDQIRDDFHG